jgi:DNA-binding CsgD family transcriptional regulator
MKESATLSDRETEIVEMISKGNSKKEIASELNISVRTVENHTRNAFIKTGCRKSTELVFWYLSNIKSIINSNSNSAKL